MSGVTEQKTLIIMLLGASVVIGLLISFVVLVGETRRSTIMKILDSLPGVVTAGLAGIASYALFHIVEHAIELPNIGVIAFILCAIATSVGLGYWMHNKTTNHHPLVRIPSRLSKSESAR
jgi:uncharacterized membrane protein YGL010W